MSRDDLSSIIDFSLSSLPGSLNDGSSLLLHLIFSISVKLKAIIPRHLNPYILVNQQVKIARPIYGNAITANDGLPSDRDKTYFNETSCFYNDVIHSCGLST